MQKDDQVTLRASDAVQVLRDLDMIVESMARIAAVSPESPDRAAQDRMTIEFLEQWEVWRRLAKARDLFVRILYGQHGAHGQEALERELEDVSYWYVEPAMSAADGSGR